MAQSSAQGGKLQPRMLGPAKPDGGYRKAFPKTAPVRTCPSSPCFTGSTKAVTPDGNQVIHVNKEHWESQGSTHTTVARGKALSEASWESVMGKSRGKATDPLIHEKGSMTLLLQLGRKSHVHAPSRDKD